MAGSYFGRLVRGGESAPLMPPRPVSHLWKTAQIDAVAAPSRTQSFSPGVRSTDLRSPGLRSTVQPTPADTPPSPSPTLKPEKPARRTARVARSQTSIPEVLPPTPAAAGSTRRETSRQQDATNWMAQPASSTADEPTTSTNLTEIHQKQSPFGPALSPYEAPLQPTSKPPQPAVGKRMTTAPRGSHPIEPIPLVGRPAAEPPIPSSVTASEEIAADVVRAPHSTFQSMGPALPLPSRHGSTPQEPPRLKDDTVHIGKIEVHVLPPSVPSHRSAPPAPPKGRLARGYALWPGW